MRPKRLRAVVVFKASTPVQWHDQPRAASFERAERELDRLNVPDAKARVDELRRADVQMIPAAALVRRMSGRQLPAADDDRVQRQLERIRDGKRLHPVLSVGDVIADGEHRLVAAAHLDPTAKVAIIAVKKRDQQKGMKEMSKAIKKNDVSPAAAAALHHCAALLRPHMSEPAIAAYVSKGLALADDVAHPTAGANGWTEPVTKMDDEFAAALTAATVAVEKIDPSDHQARAAAKSRLTKLQKAYMTRHSPGYVRAEEMRDRGEAPAPGGSLAERAAQIMKADPSIKFDDLIGRFTREEQQQYLDSVRSAA